MKLWLENLPFRVGTTSYILPDDILPNVRWLAERVRDVELVFFDVDEYCNLPDETQCRELRELAAVHGLSYTVHLPLDLDFAGGMEDVSLLKAQKVIRIARNLQPFAYVAHLACRDFPPDSAPERWQSERIAALQELDRRMGCAAKLAVENLEVYPLEYNAPVIEACGTRACLDLGHLLLRGEDPVPVLREWLSRTAVIHLHGVGTRDHESLRHVPAELLREILRTLQREDYRGVLTLEVFNQADFEESMALLEACL